MFAKLIEEHKLHEGSVLAYVSNGKILKTGIATRKGIECLCKSCESYSIFGVSAFEDHAGSGHRRPTKHIFVHDNQDGGYYKSLDMLKSGPESGTLGQVQSVAHTGESSKAQEHEVKLIAPIRQSWTAREHQVHSMDIRCETSKAMEHRSKNFTVEEKYIICNLCSLRERRGELPFCSREIIADGRLCCPKRICRECRSPLCQRTIHSMNFQSTLENGKNWNPLQNCDQCGDTYHSGCLHIKRRSELYERDSVISSFQSFCSTNCEKISMIIAELVRCSVPYQEDIPPLTVVKWNEELFLSFLVNPELSIDTLHSLGRLRALFAQKLFYAIDLLRKTYLDKYTSGRTSLFKKILYNHRSTESNLDHNGFFVVLIEEDKEVTINKNKPKEMMREVFAAATIRIHSQKVVEMPFIATAESSPGLPICSRFIRGLHEMLKQLGLLKWVIQSPPDFVEMWKKFSFHRVSLEVMKPLLKECNLLQLEDTAFMCKDIQGNV